MIPIGFVYDKWIGWGMFPGMMISTRLVLVGIVKLSEVIAGIIDTRWQRR